MGDNNNTIDKATTQLEQTLIKRVEELERINLRLQGENEARELAQEGLRYGQQFLREVISSIEDTYITVFDKNCLVNFIWGSKKLEEKYNILFQDFMGKDSDELNSELGNQIRQVFETNQSFHGEWRDNRQANEVWWDFTLSPVRDEDNEMVAVVSATRDITERKKKEEKLWLNSQIMTNLSEGVTLVRLEDEVIVYTNPTFDEMFGYNPGEMIGKSVAIVDAPIKKTPDEINGDIKQILLDTGEWHGEVRNIKKNGQIFWCYANISLFDHPEHGRVTISVTTDITKRKQAEKAVIESELKFRSVIDNSGTGIVVLDKQGRYEIVNKQAAKSLRMKIKDLIGKSLFDLFPKNIAEEYLKSNLDIIESGKGRIYQRDFDLPSGKKTFIINEQVIKDSNGKGKYLNSSSVDITERKEMELKLKESEEKYRNLIENINEGVWIIDKDALTTFVSPRMAAILGYTMEEMLGKNLFSFMDEENITKAKYYLERRSQGVKDLHEFEFVRKDNSRCIALLETSPIFDKNGNYNGAMAGIIDITKQKQTEDLLRESEEKLKELIDAVPIGISISSPQGTYLECNSQAIQIFGHDSRKEFLKTPVINHYYNPEDRAKFLRSIEKNEVKDFELQLKKRDGTFFWASITSVSQNRDGQTIFINTIQDITERKKMEKELRESENKYRSLVENIPDVVWESQTDGKTLYISPNVVKLTGYTSEEIISNQISWFDMVLKDDLEFVERSFESLFSANKDFNIEYRIRKKDGSSIWLHDRARIVHEKGGILTAEGMFSDITDFKRSEEALSESGQILRSILENSPDYIIMMDIKGEIQFINRPFIGMQRGEINNKNIYSLIPLEYHGILKNKISQLIESGRADNVELKINNPFGNPNLYEVHFGYIKSNWEIIGLIIILTEKK